MATQAQIRQRVAEDLLLTTIGEAVASQDATRIDASYTELYQRLKEENLALWASTAAVPDKVAPYYCLVMEEALARSYGISDARYTRILASAGHDGEIALMKMARLLTPQYQSTDSNEDF